MKLEDRKVIAGRAVGVKTINKLLDDAPIVSVTYEAEELVSPKPQLKEKHFE